MFIDKLLNQGSAPLLEKMMEFTSARHTLIAQNIANGDTPDYLQKDLSVDKFQSLLRERVDGRDRSPSGEARFDDIEIDESNPTANILFHDGNNRSMEMLASDEARNGLMHNVAVELLRKQFQQIETALKERLS